MSKPIRVKVTIREEVCPDLYKSLAALPLKFRARYLVQKAAAAAQIAATAEPSAQLPRAVVETTQKTTDSLHGERSTTRSNEKLHSHIMALISPSKATSTKA